MSVVPGYRESTQSWSEALRDLRDRGMNCPKLVVGDGHLGIWGALRNVYPDAEEQRCWNHKIINVLDKLPKRQHEQGQADVAGHPIRRESCGVGASEVAVCRLVVVSAPTTGPLRVWSVTGIEW